MKSLLTRWSSLIHVLALGAVAAPWSCTGGRDGFNDSGPSFGVDGGAEAGAACAGKRRCSRDARRVLDACDENVVLAECAPDQGCGGDACVPACDAAVSANGSVGCEFFTLPPASLGYDRGSCFAAFIANTWGTPARLEVDLDGKPVDVTRAARLVTETASGPAYDSFVGDLPPGQVAVVFLSQAPPRASDSFVPCPAGTEPAIARDTSITGTARGRAFHIRTSAPVSAYAMYPFGGAKSYVPSATLLLPSAAWKRDYVISNAAPVLNDIGNPTAQLIGLEDGTEVAIAASANVVAGSGIDGAAKGVRHVWTLGRGEVLQLSQREELSGSFVSANKPVAVFGGHECMFIPTEKQYCDTANQQLFPLAAWGVEIAAVPHAPRRAAPLTEDTPWRVVAATDGTTLTYEPERPEGAPAVLRRGESQLFSARAGFVVRSQDAAHPIWVFGYMTGGADALYNRGDPEFVNVVPTEQFLDHYAFYVDVSFADSSLVVVRSRSAGGVFAPVTLDCAGGEIGGFAPLGTSGKHEFTRIQLTKDFTSLQVGKGKCAAGRHTMTSDGPFGVTVWGTDAYASYAYPGGAALRTLNDVKSEVPR